MSTEPTSGPGGLRGMRRKAVATTNLVETGFVPGNEDKFPIMLTPAVDNVDLAAWCASHQDELNGYFDKYGAILFRGFGLGSAADFEAVASTDRGASCSPTTATCRRRAPARGSTARRRTRPTR